MADIIRDVVIRLKTEVVRAKIEPPDMSAAYDELKKYTERIESSTQVWAAHGQQVDSIFDEIGRRQQEQSQNLIEFGGVLTSRIKDYEELEETVSNAGAEASNSLTQAANAADNLGQRTTEAGIRAAESFRTMGDGAFTLTRGMVLLGVTGEDELGKIVRQLARVQAGFDIFKGGVDVVKGYVEGMKNLREATGAATNAQALLATGMGTVQRAAAPVVALLGPTGLVVAGATAAAVAIGAVFVKLRNDSIEATREAEAELERFQRKQEQSRLEGNISKVGGAVASALEERQNAIRQARVFGDDARADQLQIGIADALGRGLVEQRKAFQAAVNQAGFGTERGLQLREEAAQAEITTGQAQIDASFNAAEIRKREFEKERIRAQALIDEQKRLEREAQSIRSTPNLGGDAGSSRLLEIETRIDQIADERPQERLAETLGVIAEIQEETAEVIRGFESQISFARAQIAQIKAEQELIQAGAGNEP